MIWVLAGLAVLVVGAAVFGLAMCVVAARADATFERARRDAGPRLHAVDELTKRPDAADTARGMTER